MLEEHPSPFIGWRISCCECKKNNMELVHTSYRGKTVEAYMCDNCVEEDQKKDLQ